MARYMLGCVVALGLFVGTAMAQAPVAAPAAPVAPVAAPAVADKDVVDSLAANGAAKFAEAVKAAGLTETLKGAGPFTVYAPADAAFVADKEADAAKAKAAILNHVVAGKAADGKVKTMGGAELTVKANMVNDAKVVKTVAAKNGSVVVIDKDLVAAPAAK